MLNAIKKSSFRSREWLVNFFANPITVKELRCYWRSWRSMLNLSASLLSLGLVCIFSYLIIFHENTQRYNPELIGNAIFIILTIWQLFVISISTNNSSTIVSEKERQTYEALVITLLRPRDIVIGKLLASMIFSMLFVLIGLPFYVIAYALGGTDVDLMLVVLALCFVTSFLFGAINLYASSLTSNSRRANTLSGLISLILVVLLPGLLYISKSAIIGDELTRYFLMCLSAPLAIILSAIQLYNPQLSSNLFFTQTAKGNITVPMPWLVCIVTSVLLGLFFVWITTNNLKPEGWSFRFQSIFVTIRRRFALKVKEAKYPGKPGGTSLLDKNNLP